MSIDDTAREFFREYTSLCIQKQDQAALVWMLQRLLIALQLAGLTPDRIRQHVDHSLSGTGGGGA